MCGRFTLTTTDLSALADAMGVPVDMLSDMLSPDWVGRYNIAPTDPHVIVTQPHEERIVQVARWGLVPPSARDSRQAARHINARAETLTARPAYRSAFEARRCLVPADGFYEWSGPKQARQPHWFHAAGGELLLLAGLFETWWPAPGQPQVTFTIVTTEANVVMAPVHDRMPVILSDEQADTWLYPRASMAELRPLLAPPPRDLLAVREASPLVNSVRNQGPSLLDPPARLL